MTDTRRRVKLYALNAERQWDDRGTGHVSSSYVDRLKGTSLLVRAESDGSLLLESKIQPDTAYQKQQDTLIVWSEGDNFDLALSFQEKAGCDEIWEKICQVQGKDPSVEITQDIVEESEDERFDEMSDGASPIELPPCELSRLEDISELISNCLVSQARKDKLAMALESENYIKKLLILFHMCEDLENTEGLHYLYEIFKNISLLNKNTLFETMFAEETIFDVVGCLEYDPSLAQPKKHREYLRELAKFREAMPIKNLDLLAKIHQTYRVQYILDIVLPTPSVFEDNVLSSLTSFIYFKKVEIVKMIEEDDKFLTDLFKLLTDEKTLDSKRRDLVLFLKECCNFSQNLQPNDKDAFNKTLVSHGILPALEITLSIDDQETKTASIDILTYIVEFSPSVIRDYTFQQGNNTDEDQLFLNIVIEQMLRDTDPDLGGAVQLMGVLRILLDPENMLTSVNKSEKTDFLYFFYKHSVHTLIAPLLANTCGDRPAQEDNHTVQLLGLVLELLSFCVEHHTYHIKNCILNKDLLRRILVLMKSTHTFLKLGALRFLRKIIALKDEIYNRYIIKGNLFAPIIDAFLRNNGRYNLLESAILEMFEFIKLEDIKSLGSYVVENFSKILDEVEYVQTFKALKTRYERQQEKLKDRERGNSDTVTPSIMRASRYRRDQRQLDDDEEMWFNDEEESYEDESSTPPLSESQSPIADQTQISVSIDGLPSDDVRREEDVHLDRGDRISNESKYERSFSPEYDPPDSPNGTGDTPDAGEGSPSPSESDDSQPPPTSNASAKTSKKGLVDYDVDSEEEEEESSMSDSGEDSSPRASTSSGGSAMDDILHNGSSLECLQQSRDFQKATGDSTTSHSHLGETLLINGDIKDAFDDRRNPDCATDDNASPALSSEELALLNPAPLTEDIPAQTDKSIKEKEENPQIEVLSKNVDSVQVVDEPIAESISEKKEDISNAVCLNVEDAQCDDASESRKVERPAEEDSEREAKRQRLE